MTLYIFVIFVLYLSFQSLTCQANNGMVVSPLSKTIRLDMTCKYKLFLHRFLGLAADFYLSNTNFLHRRGGNYINYSF